MIKLIAGFLLLFFSASLGAQNSSSIDHTGQCFALWEFARQTTEDPNARSIFQEGVNRASKTLLRLKIQEGAITDVSDSDRFTAKMRDLLIHYGEVNQGLSLEELDWLWDVCESEFL